MKSVRNIFRVLTLLLSIGAVVLFFTSFATITSNGSEYILTGSQLAWGGKITIGAESVTMAKSADMLFCFCLTVIAVITAALNFKFKGSRFVNIVMAAVSGVYMLVVALSNAWLFVDARPLENVTDVVYAPMVIITAIVLLVCTICSIVYVISADQVEVLESKGEKLTIPKRIVRFFREYKSEVKKIVWPGPRAVVKNTIIVLIMCALVGAFIWVLDFGLGNLINLILGIK